MITIRAARPDEEQPRDRTRRRLVLSVGCEEWFITRDEARRLRNQLLRFKLEKGQT